MAVYYAVFDRQQCGAAQVAERKFGTSKLLPQCPAETNKAAYSGNVETARVVKLEATSLALAQSAIYGLFGGSSAGVPVIITEAQYKEE